MRIINCNTAVLGAGCAGLNAADELAKYGVDVHVFCDKLGGGTSFNAGSDKQTYYKIGLSGGAHESIDAMARTLFNGGSTHGDNARCMAALSAQCFFKLVQLGVEFPHNEWGEYIGYQTDHDTTCRATSAGPLTSRMMGQALLKSVQTRNVPITEGIVPVSLLDGGMLLLDKNDEPLLVNARNIILCTGSPASIYGNTVYPESQIGATGLALRQGAVANNLCYWQYGLASTDVRWNVSGSYQQAIPAYVDENGNSILDGMSIDMRILHVFLKGYQWPFDSRKMEGSTQVDMAVYNAIKQGHKVYLDYRKDRYPVVENLKYQAKTYLENCDALFDSPIERLLAINPQAYEFYKNRGIDLKNEPLAIALCAQHCNGGLAVDAWWRTTLPGVYAAGECAGVFGVTRPGGSALNETQVGSLRAAQHIAHHTGKMDHVSEEDFLQKNKEAIDREIKLFDCVTGKDTGVLSALQKEMDTCAGPMRDEKAMETLLQRIENTDPKQAASVRDYLLLRDVLATQKATLRSMILEAGKGGATHAVSKVYLVNFVSEETCVESTTEKAWRVPVRPIPKGDGWFEQVWRKYRDGEVFS